MQVTVGTHCTQEPLLWDVSLGLRSWQRGICVDLLPVGVVVTKMFPKVGSMNCSVTPLFC